MNGDFPVAIGRLAVSRAGRDKGRCLVIVGIVDENFVLVADGDLRRAERPKRKKLMHLRMQRVVSQEIARKIAGKKPLQDMDLREAIGDWHRMQSGEANEKK